LTLVVDASGVTGGWPGRTTCSGTGGSSSDPTNGTAAGSAAEACAAGGLHAPVPARRQKSYDELDPSSMASTCAQKGNQLGQIQVCSGLSCSWVVLENVPQCSYELSVCVCFVWVLT